MCLPDNSSHRRNPVVIFSGKLGAVPLRVHPHTAEFDNLKPLPASGQPLLGIKYRPFVVEFNTQSDKQKHRRRNNNGDKRQHNVHGAFDKPLFNGKAVVSGQHQGRIKQMDGFGSCQYNI